MAEIVVGIIFIVGMFSMVLFGISIFKENLTKSQQQTVKLLGAILAVFAVANIGKVIGLWG